MSMGGGIGGVEAIRGGWQWKCCDLKGRGGGDHVGVA